MKKLNKTCWMVFPALALLLTGCATSFQGHNLDPVADFPTVHVQKSVYVDLAFTGEYNGEPWTAVDEHNTRYLKNQCIEHLRNSGLFDRISTDSKDADLLLYVAIINVREESPKRQLLSGLTLSIIPFKSTDSFHLQAIVRDIKTGEQKVIKLKDHVTHWQELLLAPLALFNSSHDALDECKNRLFDNLCLEIHRAGLLD